MRRPIVSVAVALTSAVAAGVGSLPSCCGATADDQAIVRQIDSALSEAWADARVQPARPAPDGAWARRVYLDVVGRVPTLDELTAFAQQPKPKRREWLVDQLLGEAYTAERARWLATQWANLLIGRTGGRSNDSLVVREPFEGFLRAAFAENRPLDELMTQLVTAVGSVRPEDEDHNPAANYLADKMDDGGVQATAKTAQVFLGVSVQCTQCHNHPFNEGRQNQFWELNAFFRQTRAERVRGEPGQRAKARLVDRDFYGEGRGPMAAVSLAPGQPEAAETYYELRNGKLKVAYPVFIDGTSLAGVFKDRGHDHGDSGRLALVNRREELAGLIAASPDFARAAVNREWGRYLGYGFTRPVDDMGAHNPPSHPELLGTLADAFQDTGYDLSRLTRWILLSEAYGLDSRAPRSGEEHDPAAGAVPLFNRFYLRQLTAEQIYESLITATRADEMLSDERREQARDRWLRQFTTAFGNDENGESTSFDGSIPQSLAMMNSELVRRATELGWGGWEEGEASGSYSKQPKRPSGFLSSVAADPTLTNADRVERLYLAALARKPDRNELAVCNRLLAARGGDAAEALRDVWWALLNSNEFILQH
ncbi:DUF1549 domain-containing protein [Botrimarina sp.]|uniref:DUF1549 domain-containing protein n=1 Tax=Botrimarina sp. TaxID=2795802 RepID=UPI0032EB748B